MNKEALRPIGTEFAINYGPSEGSTRTVESEITYRIAAHDEVHIAAGSDATTWAERLDPVAARERQAIEVLWSRCPHCGQMQRTTTYASGNPPLDNTGQPRLPCHHSGALRPGGSHITRLTHGEDPVPLIYAIGEISGN
jgi:hypothetical protein